MKGFPFRVLFVCLLIPPLGYLFSLDLIQGSLEQQEEREIRDVLIQDQGALLEGRYSVQEAIQRNLSRHFSRDWKRKLGVRTRVLVKTRGEQRILYPVPVDEEMAGGGAFEDDPLGDDDRLRYVELAAENFRLLNQGFDVDVEVEVRHNGWLSNGLLLAWVLLSAAILYAFVRRRDKAAEQDRREREGRIEALSGQLDRARSVLQEVEEKESEYEQRIEALRKERDGLTQDTESLLEEMDQLEQGASRQKDLREETEVEVLELREELERLQRKLRKPKKRESEEDRVRKRMNALYKNLEFTDRAVEGLSALPADAQLRAEELIKSLDQDASSVPVRRKVFGKGGKSHILESEFAYSGRLYFHRTGDHRARVIAVGTKNTQSKDLAYLESYRTTQKTQQTQ
jgi:uncharacterized protein YoxC